MFTKQNAMYGTMKFLCEYIKIKGALREVATRTGAKEFIKRMYQKARVQIKDFVDEEVPDDATEDDLRKEIQLLKDSHEMGKKMIDPLLDVLFGKVEKTNG